MTLNTETIFEHWPAVYSYVRLRTRGFDRAVAEDLTGDVFERAVRAADRYAPENGAPVLAWLFAIARNRVIDWRRRVSRATFVPDLGIVDLERGTIDAGSDLHADALTLWPLVAQLTDEQQTEMRRIADHVWRIPDGWNKSRANRRRRDGLNALRAAIGALDAVSDGVRGGY